MPQDMKRDDSARPAAPFWERRTLAEMTAEEWESLCDGCGRCCLVKLEDIDSGELAYTDVACRLLDCGTCRCTSYANRAELVTDCVSFTASSIGDLDWMPATCAYRLIAEGKALYWWHPLVSEDPETVHIAGISVRGRAISEIGLTFGELEDHVVEWPARGVD
jgi:uncharacterized cysteine cluster protein YcgN (CxxCxxCC family)